VAVNLVNLMPRDQYRPFLCTTRCDGPLEVIVKADVERIRLRRKNRFDLKGLWRLTSHLRNNDVRILHAHGNTVFVSVVAALFSAHSAVLWHVHRGDCAVAERRRRLYRIIAHRISGVIAVSDPVAEWFQNRLGIPSNRVWYIPNFAHDTGANSAKHLDLPGEERSKIVCVANLHPAKDHVTLLRAMAMVVQQLPVAHLILIGTATDPGYHEQLLREISHLGLQGNVSLLGQRDDVPAILCSCDIGVLSSISEGMPLSLIEYGMAGLATVATRVGQCPEVLDEGRAGVLVHPSSPSTLAEGILTLLHSPEQRRILGERFRRRTQEAYSSDSIAGQVWEVYEDVLSSSNKNEYRSSR